MIIIIMSISNIFLRVLHIDIEYSYYTQVSLMSLFFESLGCKFKINIQLSTFFFSENGKYNKLNIFN